MNDAELHDWESREDICDDLYKHFGIFDRWDWCDISEEGIRVWNVMFDDEVEDGSAQGGVLSALAAAGRDGAFAQIAAALGTTRRALELAVSHWCEDQDEEPRPLPISPSALLRKAKEYEVWRAALKAGEELPEISDYAAEDHL